MSGCCHFRQQMGPATATCVGRQQLQLDQSFIRDLPPQQVVDRLNVSSAMSVNTALSLIQRHTGGSTSHLDVRDGCSCSLKIKRNQHDYLQSRGPVRIPVWHTDSFIQTAQRSIDLSGLTDNVRSTNRHLSRGTSSMRLHDVHM